MHNQSVKTAMHNQKTAWHGQSAHHSHHSPVAAQWDNDTTCEGSMSAENCVCFIDCLIDWLVD